MATKVIATLPSKSKKAFNFLDRADRAAIAAYVSAGITVRPVDQFILNLIAANPQRTVQEYITLLEKNADRTLRGKLTTRINKILRTTRQGRALTTTGVISIAPVSAPAYWHMDISRILGPVKTSLLIPRRSAAIQRPALRFSKAIPQVMRREARTVLNSFLDIGGLGTRWRAQDVVRAAESDVRATLASLAREHALGVALANTATPMITTLVETAVRDMVNRADRTLTAATPTANQMAL